MTSGSEDYLKAIYILEDEGIHVIAARVAEFLGLSAPAVSEALHRLEREGYVRLGGDRRIELTAEGRLEAERIVRRHRLVERWLTDRLGLDWATADEEAGALEHAISPVVEAALDRHLGHPRACPHGNPIPGNAPRAGNRGQPLSEAPKGRRLRVERIRERAEEIRPLLEYLGALGLVPGAELELLASDPYKGCVVRRGEEVYTLTEAAAGEVWVVPAPPGRGDPGDRGDLSSGEVEAGR
ncbi:MAG: metal-dependent transcriptional regulator [Bacillota bacterium]|nr:metal-dependent transcriptional regulator [Bacillota bacterium]